MKKLFTGVICSLFLVALSSLLASAQQAQLSAKDELARTLVGSKVFDSLGWLGDATAKDVLLKGSRSGNYMLRRSAVTAIGSLGNKEIIPQLKAAATDDNYTVKMAALAALVKLGETDFEVKLLGFLDDKDPSVRQSCVSNLRQFGSRYIQQMVAHLEKEKSVSVRKEILYAIGDAQYKPAEAYVTGALKDPDFEIRQAACYAISRVKEKQAAERVLKDMLKDSDISVRASAKVALAFLGDASVHQLAWQETNHEDARLRSSSYEALANLKDVNAVPVLLKALIDPKTPGFVRTSAAYGLALLKPVVKQTVSKSMDKGKDAGLVDEYVAIGYKVNNRNIVSFFTDALKDAQNPLHQDAAVVLSSFGDPVALPALRDALFQDDPATVASAAYALGLMSDKQAVSYLIQVAKNYGF